MSKAANRSAVYAFPVTLTAEEKRHKELQDKYKELKKKLAERRAAADKGDKKQGKRTMEEAEEATHDLIKKVQEGKITMKKSDDRHTTFKRSRLLSGNEGGRLIRGFGEDGEIVDPQEEEAESSQTTVWQQEKRQDSSQKTIYIKGFELHKDVLRETFERYGNIRRINIAERQKHAFIEFNHYIEAETAIREMDGQMMNGQVVHVSLAKKREVNEGGAGRGTERGVFEDMCSSNIA